MRYGDTRGAFSSNAYKDLETTVSIEGSLLEPIPTNSRILFSNGRYVEQEIGSTDNKIKLSTVATLAPDRQIVSTALNWEKNNTSHRWRADKWTWVSVEYVSVTITPKEDVTAEIMTVGILWNGLNGPTAQVTPELTL